MATQVDLGPFDLGNQPGSLPGVLFVGQALFVDHEPLHLDLLDLQQLAAIVGLLDHVVGEMPADIIG